jgi:opacity protein-like surface antigen
MKLKSSIIAVAMLSSMSFAGGDIGGVTSFENDDYINAEVEAVEPAPINTTEDIIVDNGGQNGGGDLIVATPEPTVAPTPPPKITVTETPKPTPKPVVSKSSGVGGAYVGLALSHMGVRSDHPVNLLKSEMPHQDLQKGFTAVVGYDFMKYLGAELRAALSVAGENKGQDNLAEYGIYLKPQYPVLSNLNIYGLLGYSFINMSDPATKTDPNDDPFDGDNSGFSFGAGLDYGVTQNISVFTDVVNYLRDFGGSNSTWGANFGVKYRF